MFPRQKLIGRPCTTVLIPRSCASAATDNAYGPAPMTSNWVCFTSSPAPILAPSAATLYAFTTTGTLPMGGARPAV